MLWTRDRKMVVDKDNLLVVCDDCPCCPIPFRNGFETPSLNFISATLNNDWNQHSLIVKDCTTGAVTSWDCGDIAGTVDGSKVQYFYSCQPYEECKTFDATGNLFYRIYGELGSPVDRVFWFNNTNAKRTYFDGLGWVLRGLKKEWVNGYKITVDEMFDITDSKRGYYIIEHDLSLFDNDKVWGFSVDQDGGSAFIKFTYYTEDDVYCEEYQQDYCVPAGDVYECDDSSSSSSGCPSFEDRPQRYVDKNLNILEELKDGLSWETAYTDLQSALDDFSLYQINIKGYGEGDMYTTEEESFIMKKCTYVVGAEGDIVVLGNSIRMGTTEYLMYENLDMLTTRVDNIYVVGGIGGISAGIVRDCTVSNCVGWTNENNVIVAAEVYWCVVLNVEYGISAFWVEDCIVVGDPDTSENLQGITMGWFPTWYPPEYQDMRVIRSSVTDFLSGFVTTTGTFLEDCFATGTDVGFRVSVGSMALRCRSESSLWCFGLNEKDTIFGDHGENTGYLFDCVAVIKSNLSNTGMGYLATNILTDQYMELYNCTVTSESSVVNTIGFYLSRRVTAVDCTATATRYGFVCDATTTGDKSGGILYNCTAIDITLTGFWATNTSYFSECISQGSSVGFSGEGLYVTNTATLIGCIAHGSAGCGFYRIPSGFLVDCIEYDNCHNHNACYSSDGEGGEIYLCSL